jgi:hypothetical protein
MEYTNIFEPILFLGLSLLVGVLLGSLITFYILIKDHNECEDDLIKVQQKLIDITSETIHIDGGEIKVTVEPTEEQMRQIEEVDIEEVNYKKK